MKAQAWETMKKNHKSGFSLIEIMVAALLLAVLALGGAAVLYRTGGDIQVVGNKRVALELARTEMEKLRDTDYFVLRDRANSGTSSVTAPVQVNGVRLLVITSVALTPSGGAVDNEFLELNVEVQYGRSTDETVVLDATKVLEP